MSYRLVHDYREAVFRRVFPAIFEPCIDVGTAFSWNQLQLEGAAWTMIREKPAHLLNSEFPTWDALLVAARCAAVLRAADLSAPSPAAASMPVAASAPAIVNRNCLAPS